jgi:hypothetical protein
MSLIQYEGVDFTVAVVEVTVGTVVVDGSGGCLFGDGRGESCGAMSV